MTATQQATEHAARASVELRDQGGSSVSIDGTFHALRAKTVENARMEALELLRRSAADLGGPLTVRSTEPSGVYDFLINPDGSTHLPAHEERKPAEPAPPPAPSLAPPPTVRTTTPSTAPSPAPAAPTPAPALEQPVQPVRPAPAVAPPQEPQPPAASVPRVQEHEPAAPAPVHQPRRREVQAELRRQSLLEEITTQGPAHHGVRGLLNAMGLNLAPSRAELTERDDITKVSQHWVGPRTIAVVNGKGGSAKTPSTILLSALLARYGGGNVIAWDNNSTRGTLGWRTESGGHEATVADLLPRASYLLGTKARASDLERFTHHQSVDRFDVLRSDPTQLSSEQPADEASFRAVHAVLARYYRIIMIDTGNDESLPAWGSMIERTDAIVVPTITRPEHAESARLLLDGLARSGRHGERLANQATVIVSQASASEPSPAHYVEVFNGMARAAVGIPYDPAMSNSPLLLDSLGAATRRAWLAAGAALTGALT
ncbi:ATPase [Actinomyces viscosus]|uniref:SSP-5 n=1 Tax=Actinomyces viscosus TaxID=1656 RepID=A0A448PPI9_ACTVI|nr:ATPase [Actinomyces viscosus]TFH52808.1 ATPase [Actinomyces viscosus]VEI18431.1 SSP-5 [Actinomyces viscosus]